MSERIAKFISSAGVCSRRDAERLIINGKVKVDGILINTPAMNVSSNNRVEVNDHLIKKITGIKIWKYYKPAGLITTNHDPEGRKTIFEQLKHLPRVISIGRLDINSEGLLLLTNNGAFAREMELPANRVKRVYDVRVHGKFHLVNTKLKRIKIDNIIYKIESLTLLKNGKSNAWFRIVLLEGKNREIRKIFNYLGLQVNRLIRIQYGGYKLYNLKPGDVIQANLDN